MNDKQKRGLKLTLKLILIVLIIWASPYIILITIYGVAEIYAVNENLAKAEKIYKTGINIQEHIPIINQKQHIASLPRVFAKRLGFTEEYTKKSAKENNNNLIFNYKEEIAEDILILSNIYIMQNNFIKAKKLIIISIDLTKVNEKENYEFLADLYCHLGHVCSAIEYYIHPNGCENIKQHPEKIKIIENYYNSGIKLIKKYKS